MSSRPFKTIEEHDETLRKNWNRRINKEDSVYILGDLTMSRDGKYANKLLDSLTGKKYLIKGNHENYLLDKDFDKTKYEWIKDYYTYIENKEKIVLFHYPILEWDGYFRKSIHLYGHVHNKRPEYFDKILPKNAFNVGVDRIEYTPITLKEIREKINQK